jgi:spore maturation protein CgeB
VRFVFFTHSLVSDWNHGNAHFQRGVMSELIARGHDAVAAERLGAWSRTNLIEEAGPAAVSDFRMRFPELVSATYEGLEGVEALVEDADVVIVHEWTEADVVAHLGRLRGRGAAFTLLLHDTHHRAVSAPHELDAFDLDGYDGVLAFGAVLADTYRRRGWAEAVHVWHEAADARLFRPMPEVERSADLVWIGNWGDGERTAELATYLLEPARALGLGGTVHGVRYPPEARAAVAAAGLDFGGWIANPRVPEVFARHRVTVHVPRRHYVETLPGIPTIRVFEALACGIPLVSAPWDDAEGLFRPGEDFLVARDGAAMGRTLARLLADPELAAEVAASGRQRVLARHTCAHRVDELLAILEDTRMSPADASVGAPAA